MVQFNRDHTGKLRKILHQAMRVPVAGYTAQPGQLLQQPRCGNRAARRPDRPCLLRKRNGLRGHIRGYPQTLDNRIMRFRTWLR